MDPITLIGLGSGVGGALGTGLGELFNDDDEEAQREALERALAVIQDVDVPDVEKRRVALSLLDDPRLEELIRMGPSAMEQVKADPRARVSQDLALSNLRDLVQSGGLGAQDRAKLKSAASTVAQQERGAREAILENAAARGMSGSGNELVAQLIGQQGAADRLSMTGAQVAGDAADRRERAIGDLGDMAGRVRGQDFGEKSAVAKAMDDIARWNAETEAEIRRRNIERANRVSEENNRIRNTQEMHNQDLYRQVFEDQLRKAGMESSALRGQADYYGQQAGQTVAAGQAIGQGLGGATGAFAGWASGGAPKTVAAPASSPYERGTYGSYSPSANLGGYSTQLQGPMTIDTLDERLKKGGIY